MAYLGLDLESSLNMLESISDYLAKRTQLEQDDLMNFEKIVNAQSFVNRAIGELKRLRDKVTYEN